VALDHIQLHIGFGPKGLQQLILRNQPPGMLQQITEHRKPLGSQQNTLLVGPLIAAPQTLIYGVQTGMAGIPSSFMKRFASALFGA